MDALSAKVQQLDEQINGSKSVNQKTQLTDQKIEDILQPNISLLKSVKGRLDVAVMRLLLREKGIVISSWRAYNIKRNMELLYPELFGQ